MPRYMQLAMSYRPCLFVALETTDGKLLRTFTNVIRMMEADPEYTLLKRPHICMNVVQKLHQIYSRR